VPERPRPDIDETRAALRKHDERVEGDPAEGEDAPEQTEPDEEEQDPPE
jgi:hypothetical protein